MSTKVGSSACPTFFRCRCVEASNRGAGGGWQWAGYSLAMHVAEILEEDYGSEELDGLLKELATLLYRHRTKAEFMASPEALKVARWFRRELPRCMALVPYFGRRAFATGVWMWAEENTITHR